MYRLSQLTGLHASTVSLIERGKRNPSLFVLLKLSKALGVELGHVVSVCENQQRQEQQAAGMQARTLPADSSQADKALALLESA